MFKLQPAPSFWATVSIPVPGEKKDAAIEIEFRHKTRAGLDTFLKASAEQKDDSSYLGQIIKDWKGVDVEYTPENLALLLDNYPASGRKILATYIEALTEGRVKN